MSLSLSSISSSRKKRERAHPLQELRSGWGGRESHDQRDTAVSHHDVVILIKVR